MIQLAVVVVHYNQARETNDCLASLMASDTPNLAMKIVIVDNGSSQAYRVPSKFQSDQVILLRSEANLGFTGGNNLGIFQSIERFNSDYVVMLNNDTTVATDTISELVKFMEQNTQVGIASPMIYFSPKREFHSKSYSNQERGRIIWYAGGSFDWQHLAAFHRGVDEVDRGQFVHQTTSDFATGCCAIIRRQALETVGLLEKKYFLYLEDVDYSYRVVRRGYQVGFCARGQVWHKNASTSGGAGSGLHTYYQARNRTFFTFRFGDWRAKLRAVELWLNDLISGNSYRQQAAVDVLANRYGKQVIV